MKKSLFKERHPSREHPVQVVERCPTSWPFHRGQFKMERLLLAGRFHKNYSCSNLEEPGRSLPLPKPVNQYKISGHTDIKPNRGIWTNNLSKSREEKWLSRSNLLRTNIMCTRPLKTARILYNSVRNEKATKKINVKRES